MRFRLTVQAVVKGRPKITQSATFRAENFTDAFENMDEHIEDSLFEKLPEDIDKNDLRAVMFSLKRV